MCTIWISQKKCLQVSFLSPVYTPIHYRRDHSVGRAQSVRAQLFFYVDDCSHIIFLERRVVALDTALPDRTDHEHEISFHYGTKRGSKDFGQATERKGIPRRLMNLEQGFTVCTSVDLSRSFGA